MRPAAESGELVAARRRAFRLRAWLGILIGLLGALGFQFARAHPQEVETYYSQLVFPWVRMVLTALARLSPFSLAELGGAALCLWLLALLLRAALQLLGGRRGLGSLLGSGLLRCLGALGWGYAGFLLCWGLNHARLPYADIARLDVDQAPPQADELAELLEFLVAECNRLRPLFDSDALNLVGDAGQVDERLVLGFERLGERVPELQGPTALLRKPLLAPWLSRLGIEGIYSPFTAEAHLNHEAPAWTQPFSAAHELAHGRGIAREDEANFIAWQVCRASGDNALAYSATYEALNYVGQALALADAERAARILGRLEPYVLEDRRQADAFWKAKQGLMTEVSRSSNEIYLRSQGQTHGVRSYGRVLLLLLAEWRQAEARGGLQPLGPELRPGD